MEIAHTKVDPSVNAEKERRHVQEATRGVVQLFNAVRQRQQFLEQKAELISHGSKAERRQALDEIRQGPQPKSRSTAKQPKLEVEDGDESCGGCASDGKVVEVKKKEEVSTSDFDSDDFDESSDDESNLDDSDDEEEEDEDDE